jgi:hypothetical protein
LDLRLDPDEVMDPHLVPLIREALAAPPPDVCGYGLPWEFYFRGRKLSATPWGGHKYKGTLINRTRVEVRPLVHRGMAPHVGMRWGTIDGPETAIIHHFWIDA